jgi:hypothetical protein
MNLSQPMTAFVKYKQPSFDELTRRLLIYGKPFFEGKRFKPIEHCEAVSQKDREVIFKYLHLNRNVTTGEVLTEMGRMGLRPALYEELLGFAEKYPDETKYSIVALGSEPVLDDHDHRSLVVNLWRMQLILVSSWVHKDWHADTRFLVVPK